MKLTNQLAGILTLTAGLATQVAFPTVALAKSTQSQPSFAKEFNLKSDLVRVKQQDGSVYVGYVNLSVFQEHYKPEDLNQLTAEMTGYLDFSAQDEKNYINLAGGDGDILFDLVNKGASNTYQVYGCSSTLTGCVGSALQISFKGPEVILSVNWSSGYEFEAWNEEKQTWEHTYYINLKK